jgi:hypothetical protein
MMPIPTMILTSLLLTSIFLPRRELPGPTAFGVIHFPRHRRVACHENNEAAWLEGVVDDAAHSIQSI